MSANEREYVLGTDERELWRLGLQHRIWSAQAFDLWERAGFKPGHTVLDIGCGPGYAALDLATLIGPTGEVQAIDTSERFINYLQDRLTTLEVHNIKPRLADLETLDLPEQSIDAAYARWVFCFLKNPERVVETVCKALRPGGVIAIQDYFNYKSLTLAPRSQAMNRVIDGVCQAWRQAGGDDDMVARLPAMFMRCGLHVREIRPHLRVARPGTLLWEWPTSFFSNFVPRLVEMGILTKSESDAFFDDWKTWANNPAAFFVTPPVFDVIAIKKS